MKHFARLTILLLIVLLCAAAVQAQDGTASISNRGLQVTYPVGWLVELEPDGGIFLANSQAAMDALTRSRGDFGPADIAIQIVPPSYLRVFGASSTADPETALQAAFSALSVNGTITPVAMSQFEDAAYTAVRSLIFTSGFGLIYALETGAGTILAAVQIDPSLNLQPTVEDILSTITFDGSFVEGDLFTAESGDLAFRSPSGWVIESDATFISVANSRGAMDNSLNGFALLPSDAVALIAAPSSLEMLGLAPTSDPVDVLETVMREEGLVADIELFNFYRIPVARAFVTPDGFTGNTALYAVGLPSGTIFVLAQTGGEWNGQFGNVSAQIDGLIGSIIVETQALDSGFTAPSTPTVQPTTAAASTTADALVTGQLTSSVNEQLWSVFLTEGDVLTIEMAAVNDLFDTRLYLYLGGEYPGGNAVAENDDSRDEAFGYYNSRISDFVVPYTGEYVVRATSFAGAGIGEYTLAFDGRRSYSPQLAAASASSAAAQPTAVPARGGTVWAGGELTSTVNEQLWNLNLAAGDTVTIEMIAIDDAFDTRLYMYRSGDYPGGTPVAENDDSRDNALGYYNSRIADFVVPQSGDYIIRATSFANAGVGRYTLAIHGAGSAPQLIRDAGSTVAVPTAVNVNVDQLLESAIASVEANSYEAAVEQLNTILGMDPLNAAAYFYRGRAQYHLGNYEQALSDLNMALEYEFESPSWNYNVRGLTNAMLGLYDDAYADFAQALTISPNNVRAYANRAWMAGNLLGDWDTYTADHRVLTQLEPDNARWHNGLAWGLVQLGRYQEALESVNQALELEPNYHDALDTRGWAYLGLGNYQAAEDDFNLAIALGGTYSIYGLAALYNELGNTEEALRYLGLYIENAGDNPAPEALALLTELEGGGEIQQWAVAATGTSQYGTERWGFGQATGEPNTDRCGDVPTAWASASSRGSDMLALEFAEAVVPTQVNIYQTYNPGSIIRVELTNTETGSIIAIPNSADPPGNTPCPGVFTLNISGVDSPVNGVIIYVDQTIGGGWNEIDAVELVGVASGNAASAASSQSSGTEIAAFTTANFVGSGELTSTVTEQIWTTNLGAGDRITVTMVADDPTALDPLLEIYTRDAFLSGRSPLARNDDVGDDSLGGNRYNAQIRDLDITQGGDYVIVATRFSGAGTYRISIESRGYADLELTTR